MFDASPGKPQGACLRGTRIRYFKTLRVSRKLPRLPGSPRELSIQLSYPAQPSQKRNSCKFMYATRLLIPDHQ